MSKQVKPPPTIFFIGAGPGDPELITVKGKRLLGEADVVVYAGSLVNPEVLKYAKKDVVLYNSAEMDLDEIISAMVKGAREGKLVVRLHSGDPSVYGAIAEQMERLDKEGINYEIVPGVSSVFAAAASLKRELTLPEISQTLILTRVGGKTMVPDLERLSSLAQHQGTMAIFLSVQHIEDVVNELLKGYSSDTPVAVIHKASWKDERILTGTLTDISEKVKKEGIDRTAIILIGKALNPGAMTKYSKLYSKDFKHTFRDKKEGKVSGI